LLRPDAVKEMRQGIRDGKVNEAQRREVEDKAVRDAIALQERVGLDVISDGELRRSSWISTFSFGTDATHKPAFSGLNMVEEPGPSWIRFWRDNNRNPVVRPGRFTGPRMLVTEKLAFANDIVGPDYPFLKANAHTRTKFTFPAPSYHRVFYHKEHSKKAYATAESFLEDMKDHLLEYVVRPLLDMGCDYIQMDAPNYGQFYVDPEVRAEYEAEGHDLDAYLKADAEVDNALFEGITGITKALHVCRGNGPGGIWSADGGYGALAGEMFPRLPNIDTLLLEYDTPRAGDFSPLKQVLPGTTVVLGLLTTKEPALEDAAQVEARIREAARYMPLDDLTLSTQCGFASAEGGNPLTQAEQEAKLRLVRQVASKVWPNG
jgi:5-methyltetrahydropteroyltriglutamate--homocysteine methyltransferase